MLLHDGPLLFVKPARIKEGLLGHGQFADSMKEGGIFSFSAKKAAAKATPRECSAVKGDLLSTMEAINPAISSSSARVRRRGKPLCSCSDHFGVEKGPCFALKICEEALDLPKVVLIAF